MSKVEAFALELVKIAKEQSDRQPALVPRYLQAMKAGLPFVVAQGVADIPEGMIEKGVDWSIRRPPGVTLPTVLSNTGVSRLGSRIAAGSITSPIFLSAMRDLTNKDKKNENQNLKSGLGKILLSGGIYSSLRAATEAVTTPGLTRPEKIKLLKGLVGVRTAMGLGGALNTAYLASRSVKASREPEEKRTIIKTHVLPTVLGAAFGAGKGGLEEVWTKGHKEVLFTPQGRTGLKAGMAGRAAGAAFSTAVMSEILKKTLKPKTQEKQAGDMKSAIFNRLFSWAKEQPKDLVETQLQKLRKKKKTISIMSAISALEKALLEMK